MSSDLTLADIHAAAARIAGYAVRTPLVRLSSTDDEPEVWLKLETLQPIGAFKIRGAANAMAAATPEQLRAGVYTCSAGNRTPSSTPSRVSAATSSRCHSPSGGRS
jgi:threonine dehydratase